MGMGAPKPALLHSIPSARVMLSAATDACVLQVEANTYEEHNQGGAYRNKKTGKRLGQLDYGMWKAQMGK